MLPKNITVNTTLSKKHPWLLLRPGGTPRDPPPTALGSAKCPRRTEIFLPFPRVLAQGVCGNGPLVRAGPLHVPAMAPPWPGGSLGSGCGSTEEIPVEIPVEIPADWACARKAGLVPPTASSFLRR